MHSKGGSLLPCVDGVGSSGASIKMESTHNAALLERHFMYSYNYVGSFKFANFDSNHLACLEGQFRADGKYGYVLVSDHLVPYSFINRLEGQLGGMVFEYDEVHALEEIFDADFLLSLSSKERKLIGPCLLLLIEKGGLWIANSRGM